MRPYSANAWPSEVGRPSRPNIRSRSYARTCPVTSEPVTRSISGQCVVTLVRLTLLRARSSSGR